jgi:hypothetical protein
LTSDGRRRGGGGRVSDAIVGDIFSETSKMNVYTIEDLEFVGIGRMIVIVTVRREREKRQILSPISPVSRDHPASIPFISPSISLSLKGRVTGFEYASMIYGLPD